jgi:hypothetical protein
MLISLAPWVGVATGDVDSRVVEQGDQAGRPEQGMALSQLLDIEPGPTAMALLGAIDPAALDAEGQIALVQAWERQHAWLCAQQQTVLAAAAGPEPLTSDDWVQDEIAAAIRLSGRAAQQRIHVARMLTESLPQTQALLAAGVLSWRHALVMVEASARLDRPTIELLEARVLPTAAQKTAAEFNRAVRRAVLALEPEAVALAHEAAKAQRGVRVVPEPDGMASVVATMAATDARAVFLALDALARGRQAAEGGRRGGIGIEAHRADALIALADAALADRALPRAHGRRVELQVLIELPTLLGLRDNPAELVGYGPIPASMARELAADAAWRRLVVDPTTGHLLDYGRRTYRAPSALADYLMARDRRCRFVGCGQPAFRCDIDHVEPYEKGGRTSGANCCMLCRRHHRLKTRGRWKLELRPDGSVSWQSAAGFEYQLRPRSQLDQ